MVLWQAASFGLLEMLGGEPKGFIESLPAPMQINWRELLVVMLLVTLLYFFLKASFFKPMIAVMDQREQDMNAGSEAKALAMAMIEQRQAEYQSKLRDLRAQAFSHRKILAEAASKEKQALLDQTRTQAQAQREVSLAQLKSQAEAASGELMAQVDVLAESMAQNLLKQA
ncbi:MAG: ATP synthase F0 subunit B [Holophagaceae bacterium]|nr:ATP synthase F0 subunit B [Holophagaceae bacterium]